MYRADTNSECMQTPGRDHEAHAVEQGALTRRKFGSMRVAVKDRKNPDQQRGHEERSTHFEHHRGAEQNGRCSDAILDTRNRHAHKSEHSADRHHQRKRNWQYPNGRGAKLRAPQTHGNHRQYVVQSGDRMEKTSQETRCLTLLHMCVCRGGSEKQQAERNPKSETRNKLE